jgi:signal transduction histidine kinase
VKSRFALRPPLVDVAIALAFVAMTVAEGLLSPLVTDPTRHLLVAGTAMAALAWRRLYPVPVAVLVVTGNILINPQGEFTLLLSLVLVCFTVGYEAKPPMHYAGLALVTVPFILVSIQERLEPSDLAAACVFFVGPWLVGNVLRSRVASADEAVARAARLEREAELEAATARAEERTRIARELHDIVSHSISVVTIQTQAVRRRLGPDHAREAADLAAVEATAREALAEMRRLFGVLRDEGGDSPDLAPQPGLSELERLVRNVNGGELEARLEVEGEPVPLSPGVDLAAYRIAQEGLTNAVRHSGASEAVVRLRYSPRRLDIEVSDNGRGLNSQSAHDADRNPGGHSSGHGLVGIRERVALYNGTVTLEPGAAGGTTLAATLPLAEEAVGR